MQTSFSNADRAEILTQALPYIRQYNGKIVVVKYGGNAMVNEALRQQVMEDIVLLWLIGVKIVLVHGGGPEISDLNGRGECRSRFRFVRFYGGAAGRRDDRRKGRGIRALFRDGRRIRAAAGVRS